MPEEHKKFDTGKLRYDLIPPKMMEGLAEVLTFGAAKYGDNNWRAMKEEDLYRTVAATMRHFEAYRSGEIHDPESGMPHLWHVMANITFLNEIDTANHNKISPSDINQY